MIRKPSLNAQEAPIGFYAGKKKDINIPNVCDCCDARKLCIENKNNWTLENRCMSYDIKAFHDGNVYNRKDGCSVVFKKK